MYKLWLGGEILEISIDIISDEKGYLDRECPHEECEFVFMIGRIRF
mgnify:CR=1 FL=1